MVAREALPAPWSFYGQPTRMVGRVKELHRLREAVRNAIETRQRRAVLLVGPAGIGKSRLINEFTETLEEHVDRATVLYEACRRDGGPPYAVFKRLLCQRFYVLPGDSDEIAREKLSAGLTQVLGDEELGEESAHFIGHLVGLRFPQSRHVLRLDGDPRRVEARAVACFARFLRADAHRAPLVVCLDNAHHASSESLELLLRCAQEIDDAPILFIAAAREGFKERQRDFTRAITRAGEVLELTGLSDRECREVVRGLLGRLPEPPEELIKRTVEKALGNPLTVEQIIELYIERGALIVGPSWTLNPEALEEAHVPGTLRDVVRSKLARLSASERGLLERAACVGDVFWTGCVEVLWRADEGHRWEDSERFWNGGRHREELERALMALKQRHILLKSSKSSLQGDVEYAFKHTLEREIVYEAIEGPRRARYHRLVAQWLEGQTSLGRAVDAERLAHHWERGHHPRKAAKYYLEAGDNAFERHVNGEAMALFQQAAACLTDDDTQERLQVFHRMGKIHLVQGDHADALGHFQEMLRLAWLLDDRRQGGLAFNKMGQCYRGLGEYELALAHFKRGLKLFREVEDIRGLASTADDIGRVHRLKGELDLAEERVREGLRLRRYLEDPRSVAVSLLHLSHVLTERGDFLKASETLAEALGLAQAAGDDRTIADLLTAQGAIAFHQGDLESALALWNEALALALAVGERPVEGMLQNNLGETLLSLGRTEEARERLEAAALILERVGDRRGLSDTLRNLGALHLSLANVERALELTERARGEALAVGSPAQIGLAERTLAEIHSRTVFGDAPERAARLAEAETHFAQAITQFERAGLEAELARTLLAQGSALAEAGQELQARAPLERALRLFERLEMRDGARRAHRVLEAL